jgi:hypothetical protein
LCPFIELSIPTIGFQAFSKPTPHRHAVQFLIGNFFWLLGHIPDGQTFADVHKQLFQAYTRLAQR